MVFKSKFITIDVKGVRGFIAKTNQFKKITDRNMFNTGKDLMNNIKQDSQKIIKDKQARWTTGALIKSIEIKTDKTNNGYKHTLTSELPYAKKVHSGYTPYVETRITSGLYNWVKNNLGKKSAEAMKRRGSIKLGFPSTKRKYNPQIGMRFFDDAFYMHVDEIPKHYDDMIKESIFKSGLR